jgi:hypothetical protein
LAWWLDLAQWLNLAWWRNFCSTWASAHGCGWQALFLNLDVPNFWEAFSHKLGVIFPWTLKLQFAIIDVNLSQTAQGIPTGPQFIFWFDAQYAIIVVPGDGFVLHSSCLTYIASWIQVLIYNGWTCLDKKENSFSFRAFWLADCWLGSRIERYIKVPVMVCSYPFRHATVTLAHARVAGVYFGGWVVTTASEWAFSTCSFVASTLILILPSGKTSTLTSSSVGSNQVEPQCETNSDEQHFSVQ